MGDWSLVRFIDRSVNGAGTPDQNPLHWWQRWDKHAEAGIKQHQVIIVNASSPTPTPTIHLRLHLRLHLLLVHLHL